MAAIASGDVAYTLQSQTKDESGNKRIVMKLIFGDGALTYPSGGIPLVKGSLGCPNVVKAFNIVDEGAASGYEYKYDFVNNKLRLYQSAGLTPAGTISAHTHTIPAGTDAAGGDTGSATPTFTGTAVAAGALAEVGTSVAPAAQTLYVEVVGW